jgi:hypothetical protein
MKPRWNDHYSFKPPGRLDWESKKNLDNPFILTTRYPWNDLHLLSCTQDGQARYRVMDGRSWRCASPLLPKALAKIDAKRFLRKNTKRIIKKAYLRETGERLYL